MPEEFKSFYNVLSNSRIASEQELNYKDIYIVPNKKCILKSRKLANTSNKLGSNIFDIPIIPANMKSVVNENTCLFLAQKNIFYIMHRFTSQENILEFCKYMNKTGLNTSISIGVKDEDRKFIEYLSNQKIKLDYITIDIAYAYTDVVKDMIDRLRAYYSDAFIIAGNVADSEGACFLRDSGANAVKVGIGGGGVCSTKNITGFYRPMVSTILDCVDNDIPIIADGGIKEPGDISKALALGADFVMAGTLFAGYEQSAKEHDKDGNRVYYGSASAMNKGEYKNVEGFSTNIEEHGDMNLLLQALKESLQSAISYSGGNSIDGLRNTDIVIVK